jgi:hypothetical protein
MGRERVLEAEPMRVGWVGSKTRVKNRGWGTNDTATILS